MGRVISKNVNSTATGINGDVNSLTSYTYLGPTQVGTVSVVNITPSGTSTTQTTTYGYGGALDLGLVTHIAYPDSPQDSETYLYDNLGDVTGMTDRNKNVHSYAYDALGRRIQDHVTSFGPSVDQTVQALDTSYDALDRPVKFTSEGINSTGGFGDLNQVLRTYTPYGQLATEYQEHNGDVRPADVTNPNGSVTPASYKVQYFYDPSSPTHLQQVVYPDGRTIWYGYNGMDASAGRVSSISDGSTTAPGQSLETYSYQGLDTIIGRLRPQANTSETIKLNPFGQVSTLQWNQGVTAWDSFAYGYDADGNLLWTNNVRAGADGQFNLSESYAYNHLNQQTSFSRGTLDTNHIANGTSVTWQVDSQGNRYGGRYGTAYTLLNDSAQGAVLPAGQSTLIPVLDAPGWSLNAGYDAWGRLVKSDASYNSSGGSTLAGPARETVYTYDALGRVIQSSDYASSADAKTATPTAVTQSFYSGNNVVEERDGSGVVQAQYVWAPDGALILRDRENPPGSNLTDSRIPQISGAPLNERLYAQSDARGSITSITDVAGNVMERYLYDQDGIPSARQANWSPYDNSQNSSQPNSVTSHYDWQFLYKGMRWHWIISNNNPNGTQNQPAWGFYQVGAGQWYDPNFGRMLQPDEAVTLAGINAYVPYTKDANWLKRNTLGLTMGAVTGAGILATVLSAGLLAPEAATLIGSIDLALAGAAGGVVGSFGNAYIAGQSGWHLARSTAIGGLAGAAGGFAGAWAAPLGKSIFVRNFLRCGVGEGLFGGAAGGFAYGAVDGGYNGYMQHGWGGIGRGAVVGAFEGGLAGGVFGAGIGFLSGRICFVAGTQVVVGVEDEHGQDALALLNAREGGSSVSTALRLKYVTTAIEELVARGGGENGSGGDQFVLARREHDPRAPLTRCRISRTYRRIAYHLQALTVRDADGQQQTIRVTDEHPFYVQGTGWTKARSLVPSDLSIGVFGDVSIVIENIGESQPEGIAVYNLEVGRAHTYFIRAERSLAEPVWVHNADGYGDLSLSARREAEEAFMSENGMSETTMSANRGSAGSGPRGNYGTQIQLETVRDQFLADNPEYDHVAGGRDQLGAPMTEEFLEGPDPEDPLEFSAHPDLTFQNRLTGQRVRVQTVTVDANGNMIAGEAAAYQRIIWLTGEPVIAIPKI